MVAVTLNGQSLGAYQYESGPSDSEIGYLYNIMMYTNESLAPPDEEGMHNLTLTSYGGALFDYATYTYVVEVLYGFASLNI